MRLGESPMTQPDYQFVVRLMSAAEGGGYMIDYPGLRGCTARGATFEEVMANGRDAQAAWMADALHAGRFVPEAGAKLATWNRLSAMSDAAYERAIPYRGAGTLICGGKPPPWLLHNLHMSGLLLFSCRADEAKSPTASKMREHLQDMNRSAIALKKMLSDPEVLRLLGPQPYTFDYASAHTLMSDLQRRSDFALINLPSGRGKENVRRLFELLPRTLCALIVVECWKLFSSLEEPPNTSSE
jgi:predicted RNase H-like HicB family nuclease